MPMRTAISFSKSATMFNGKDRRGSMSRTSEWYGPITTSFIRLLSQYALFKTTFAHRGMLWVALMSLATVLAKV